MRKFGAILLFGTILFSAARAHSIDCFGANCPPVTSGSGFGADGSTSTVNGGLTMSGTITANKFVGDGSGISGITVVATSTSTAFSVSTDMAKVSTSATQLNLNAAQFNISVNASGSTPTFSLKGGSVTLGGQDLITNVTQLQAQYANFPSSGIKPGVLTVSTASVIAPAGTTGLLFTVSSGTTKLFQVGGTSITANVPLYNSDGVPYSTGGAGGSSGPESDVLALSQANNIISTNIVNGQVIGQKIGFRAVVSSGIATNQVLGINIGSDAIISTHIAAGTTGRNFNISNSTSIVVGSTNAPRAMVHVATSNGFGGPIVVVTTGATKLFEVNGASIVAGVRLLDANGNPYSTSTAGGGAGGWTQTATSLLDMDNFSITDVSSGVVNGEWRVGNLVVTGSFTMNGNAPPVDGTTYPVRVIMTGGVSYYVTISTWDARAYTLTVGSFTSIGMITSTTGHAGPGNFLTGISSVTNGAVGPNQLLNATPGTPPSASLFYRGDGNWVAPTAGSGGNSPLEVLYPGQSSSSPTATIRIDTTTLSGSGSASTATLAVNLGFTSNAQYLGWIKEVAISSVIYSTPGAQGYGVPNHQVTDSTGTYEIWMVRVDTKSIAQNIKLFLVTETTGTEPSDVWEGIALGTPSARGMSNADVNWVSSMTVILSSPMPGIQSEIKQSSMVTVPNSNVLVGGSTNNDILLIKRWNIPPPSGASQRMHQAPSVYLDRRNR